MANNKTALLTTDRISYNVNDRGRKALGKDRNFDTVALAKIINGPAVQEKVKHGDMYGYYGHWARLKFGLNPVEVGVVDGRVVPIQPDLRTVEVSAQDDGTITHVAEIFDTAGGAVAAKLYQTKAGGFSSAIDVVPGSNPYIPKGFFGFDYVLEPNYTTNRGHRVVLDGIMGAEAERDEELMALLDAAMGESIQTASILNTMFDSLHAQHIQTLQAYERLAAENDLLIGRLASGEQVLDSAQEGIAPMRTLAPIDYSSCLSIPRASLQALPKPDEFRDSTEARYLESRFNLRLA